MQLPKRTFAYLQTTLLVIFISGCTVHTVENDPQPTITVTAPYSIDSAAAVPSGKPWWYSFDDDILNTLIAAGLDNNLEVAQALARLSQAEALSVRAGAARLPEVGITADVDQEWSDDDDWDDESSFGLSFTWEIDAFNRLRSLQMQRELEQQARQEDVETVKLGLSGAIAQAYFEAIGWRSQLKLLNQQLEVDRNLLELTQMRYDTGFSALIDVLQQSSQLAETESLVPPVEAGLRTAENRLDVLLGEPPDGKNRVPEKSVFIELSDLPFIGVPTDLLMYRPDLRSLRNELIAADAGIGQAMAERLPRLTLNGSFLYEDGDQGSGLVGSLVAGLFQPLLDWGSRKAEVERNRALYTERLAGYTQAYIAAIEEVETTLYRERKQREFLDRLQARLQLLDRTVEEATERYANGLTDYLPVLDALKEQQRLQRVIVQQQQELLFIRIQLHRAVGGAIAHSPEAPAEKGVS